MALELPIQDPCYFCEIVAGHADQWNVIATCELTMTLLNGRQYEIGQCIIVPKRHAPTLLDINANEIAAVMDASQEIARRLMKTFDPTGLLIYQNNGVGSGQEVPHYHLHVVPRQPNSDWGLGPPHIARLERSTNEDKFDHAMVTADKRATVDRLREMF